MRPRKIQILKDAIKETDNPLHLTILEGLVKLFEWDSKMKELFPNVESNEEFVEYHRATAAEHCAGYYCTFSPNFLIEDETKAKPFDAPEEEQLRDAFNWFMISVCPYVRDLASLYRTKENVRQLVDKIINDSTTVRTERRTYRNILTYGWFMDDNQRERVRYYIIQESKKRQQ